MPDLWKRAPDVRLVVAGKGSEQARPSDRRVDARGFVANLRTLYDEAGCVAVPLLDGGGSPLKFVEALAFGVPIAATPRAAAGLDLRAGEHYLEAEPRGAEFATALLGALDPDRGNSLAQAGRERVEVEYSIEALARRLAP
jgi:glycosyltransferase involved in cell wall biosynthesis